MAGKSTRGDSLGIDPFGKHTLSRRRLLWLAGVGAFAATSTTLLAACGEVDDEDTEATEPDDEDSESEAEPEEDDEDIESEAESEEDDEGEEEPQTGGELTTLLIGDLQSLDIHVSQLEQLRHIAGSIYDTLVYQDGLDIEILPRLASSWEWTDDVTLEMTLEEGVEFHGGQPFTAEDVKFSFDRVLDPDVGSPLVSQIEEINEVEIVDDQTVRLHLNGPWPALVESLTNVYIYSHESTDDSIQTEPNGTGPFRFIEWRQEEVIRIEKNPDYWISGLPYLDAVEFRPVEEQETRLSMMETESADLMFNVDLRDFERVEQHEQLEMVFLQLNERGNIMYMNNGRPPMDNPSVRLAVSYAMDRATFVEQFMGGYGVPNTSPWIRDHWAYNPINDDAFPYDLERAAELLEDAGYPEGVDADGNQLEIDLIFPIGWPEWNEGSVMLQASLDELGVQVNVLELEPATWIERLVETDDFDVSWDLHGFQSSDPAITLSSPFQYAPGEQNLNRYEDEELAQLIDEGGRSTDQEERREIYFSFQERWNEIQPGLVIGERDIGHAIQRYVHGFIAHPRHMDFREVWVES